MKRAFTSKDVMVSPGSNLLPWELLNEVLGVFEVMWGLAYNGFDDVGKLLSNAICDGPLLETMGLRGVPALWILGRP